MVGVGSWRDAAWRWRPVKDRERVYVLAHGNLCKYVLKNQFKLNKEEEHSPVIDIDYWDADPETIPKHLKN